VLPSLTDVDAVDRKRTIVHVRRVSTANTHDLLVGSLRYSHGVLHHAIAERHTALPPHW